MVHIHSEVLYRLSYLHLCVQVGDLKRRCEQLDEQLKVSHCSHTHTFAVSSRCVCYLLVLKARCSDPLTIMFDRCIVYEARPFTRHDHYLSLYMSISE